jgi:hypothetical protein
VHTQDDREHAAGTLRLDDPHAYIADLGGDSDPLLIDRQLLHERRLDIVEYLACGRIVELVDERRCRGRVSERLRGGLENHPGLNGHDDAGFPVE